ncbi:putative disease resistance protein RGA3 [Populus trichocarpa]|uniref:putative disease resistance protein RGA3 n=1 Tax=Populus trichocarpa TaxID=3694 RepID=UPI000D18A60C|nr:putative disease resistance protein RGA3 [Populus trichocarpa]|eukprot:XP_024437116.1 putative disease resistance protein RGA3 [Populus trichocarpa]
MDKKIKIWLQKLKDVASDAEDLLDMIHARVLSKQVLESDRFTYSPSYDMGILGKGKLLAEEFGELMNRKVRLASHIVESIPNHFINLRQLRDVRERLDDISKEMGEFQLKEVLISRLPQTGNREGRETGAHIVESEGDFNNWDWRYWKNNRCSIAYNDERVKKHFYLKIWISLYDDFNPRKIMSEMLDYAVKGKYYSMSQMGLLQSQLRTALYGKRYLLVLDDVWNEDPDEWDKVRNLLGDGTNGNKAIVTNRSQKVASIMGSSPAYHLEALSRMIVGPCSSSEPFLMEMKMVFQTYYLLENRSLTSAKECLWQPKFLES